MWEKGSDFWDLCVSSVDVSGALSNSFLVLYSRIPVSFANTNFHVLWFYIASPGLIYAKFLSIPAYLKGFRLLQHIFDVNIFAVRPVLCFAVNIWFLSLPFFAVMNFSKIPSGRGYQERKSVSALALKDVRNL